MRRYDRDFDRAGYPRDRSPRYQGGRFPSGYAARGDYDVGYAPSEYGYFGRPADGYDRNYHTPWETDRGDPFGDRAQHTPVRVMRGQFRNPDHDGHPSDRDRGMYGGYTGRGRYDRDWRR